ncbi:hypothetical protein [Hymenobacter volaticus]|uniref:Outer membrane protein beta-barrel domain-containing protein n=1 Tax=Hymenobacter volaticus TaxID=2932254 RepID=A0ABY4GFU9_9BACT|nr:hypothetical protein [Hymenobacter volaticus]UOQ69737.1 hypothetical protein MUN86_29950 [Hymenobacter volaticus]
MIKPAFLSAGLLILPLLTYGQVPSRPGAGAVYRNWPVVAGVQFHTLAMPFSDRKSAFSNPGLSVGTEFRYNRRATLVQSLPLGYYRNRYAGNGLYVAPQLVYRPQFGPLYAELRAGAGVLYTMQPGRSYELEDNTWQTRNHGGKLTLMLPVGLSLGYSGRQAAPRISPFVSYQVFVLHGYNPGIPVVPNLLLQAGVRAHLFHH